MNAASLLVLRQARQRLGDRPIDDDVMAPAAKANARGIEVARVTSAAQGPTTDHDTDGRPNRNALVRDRPALLSGIDTANPGKFCSPMPNARFGFA